MSNAYSDGKKLQGADEFDPRTLPPFPPTDRTGDVDMSLIDCNLRLTPAERIAQHYRAVQLALRLKRAGKRHYGGIETASNVD